MDLAEICKLKMIAWPYPLVRQMEWISKNIKKNDLHLMLFDNGLAAYLSLIDIRVEIDGSVKKGYGLCTICSREPGQYYGVKLIEYATAFIQDEKRIGLGFASKDWVANLYDQFGWELIEKDKLNYPFDNTFNTVYLGSEFKNLKYSGWQF